MAVAAACYVLMSGIAGVLTIDGALHPKRRPLLKADAEQTLRFLSREGFRAEDVSLDAKDEITLRAWYIRASANNGSSVIVLHGLGDNRLGALGYAGLFLRHGYNVLVPDARAHGISGGDFTTYGLLERNDVRAWFEWIATIEHPSCIYGFGESMGAAELLQSLEVEPHFCAVVAESSFSNFREISYVRVGQFFHTGPWLGRTLLRPTVESAFLYARWKYKLNVNEISPEAAVAQTRVPVLLIHGKIDSNIPAEHSVRIAAQNRGVALWLVPNADHCGAMGAAPEAFEERVIGWFASHTCFTQIAHL